MVKPHLIVDVFNHRRVSALIAGYNYGDPWAMTRQAERFFVQKNICVYVRLSAANKVLCFWGAF